MTVKPTFSMQLRSARVYLRQFGFSLGVLPRTIAFIREQQIWKGMFSYGWISRLFMLLALLGGLKFLTLFVNWVNQLFNAGDPIEVIGTMGLFAKDLAVGSYEMLFSSGSKYIMLILLEVVVFHFARRTLEILTGNEAKAGWKDCVDAQTPDDQSGFPFLDTGNDRTDPTECRIWDSRFFDFSNPYWPLRFNATSWALPLLITTMSNLA